jgi:hypothetical protein
MTLVVLLSFELPSKTLSACNYGADAFYINLIFPTKGKSLSALYLALIIFCMGGCVYVTIRYKFYVGELREWLGGKDNLPPGEAKEAEVDACAPLLHT